jgi:hypothetical protein
MKNQSGPRRSLKQLCTTLIKVSFGFKLFQISSQKLQVSISESSLTVIIWILWRQLNALSLQDFLLCAIFVDKTWVRKQAFSRFVDILARDWIL